MFVAFTEQYTVHYVLREIRGLEGEAVEDARHTSSLNKLVVNLQNSLDTYRYQLNQQASGQPKEQPGYLQVTAHSTS